MDNKEKIEKVQTFGQLKRLTLGQKGMYNLLAGKIKRNQPLTMDDVVTCYCESIKSVFIYETWSQGKLIALEIDIWDS